jgi:hypothetical protein
MPRPVSSAPVIVIGMHRSGTTMITDMLERLGLFMGWAVQENSESTFFTARNEKLLSLCGGSWEKPRPIELLLQDKSRRNEVTEQLRRDMGSIRFLSYLGPRRFLTHRRLQNIDFPWGWKDPRNTFLLPIWLDLFPNARIVHIHRNGIDVARSLAHREIRAAGYRLARLSPAGRFARTTKDWWDQCRNRPILLTVRRSLDAVARRLTPLGPYDRFTLQETADLGKAFELWCAYVQRCSDMVETISNECLTLKYDDFLAEPEKNLETLCAFCGLKPGRAELQAQCKNVRTDRRHTFKGDPEAVQLYERVRANQWMVKFGYGDL